MDCHGHQPSEEPRRPLQEPSWPDPLATGISWRETAESNGFSLGFCHFFVTRNHGFYMFFTVKCMGLLWFLFPSSNSMSGCFDRFQSMEKPWERTEKFEESPALDSWATQVYHGSEQCEAWGYDVGNSSVKQRPCFIWRAMMGSEQEGWKSTQNVLLSDVLYHLHHRTSCFQWEKLFHPLDCTNIFCSRAVSSTSGRSAIRMHEPFDVT